MEGGGPPRRAAAGQGDAIERSEHLFAVARASAADRPTGPVVAAAGERARRKIGLPRSAGASQKVINRSNKMLTTVAVGIVSFAAGIATTFLLLDWFVRHADAEKNRRKKC